MEKTDYQNAMQEFRSYYNKKAAKLVGASEQKRIANLKLERILSLLVGGQIIIFSVIFGSCFLLFVFPDSTFSVFSVFWILIITVFICQTVVSFVYEKVKQKNRSQLYNKYSEFCTIDGYDEYLKKELMLPFLKILLSEPSWEKITDNKRFIFDDFIIKNKLISNFPLLSCLGESGLYTGYSSKNTPEWEEMQTNRKTSNYYDDYIRAKYKDVNIEMIELSTYPCRFENVFIDFSIFFFISIFLLIFGIVFLILLFVMNDIITIHRQHLYGVFIFVAALPLIYFVLYKIKQKKCFRGIIVTLDMNKKFKGSTTIIQKESADKVNFDVSMYKKVGLEFSEFTKQFDVYSDNQIEARYILTTSMMERIFNLRNVYGAKNVRFHFADKKVMIAINTGRDMFAMGQFFDFKKLASEIKSLINIIEELKLNQKIGL